MAYKSYVNDVKKVLNENKREFCEKVGVLCVGEVQSIAPVLTGNLKRSVAHEVMEGDKGVYIGVTADAPYALAVEKGTTRQAAQHPLENGCTNAIPKITNVAKSIYHSKLGGR